MGDAKVRLTREIQVKSSQDKLGDVLAAYSTGIRDAGREEIVIDFNPAANAQHPLHELKSVFSRIRVVISRKKVLSGSSEVEGDGESNYPQTGLGSYIQVAVRGTLQSSGSESRLNKLFGRSIDAEAVKFFAPRELNQFALIVANNFVSENESCAPLDAAERGDFCVPTVNKGSWSGAGLKFESPVFVNGSLILPKVTETSQGQYTPSSYSPVTFASRLVLGGGKIFNGRNAGDLIPFKPFKTDGFSGSLFSRMPHSGGIHGAFSIDGRRDAGLDSLRRYEDPLVLQNLQSLQQQCVAWATQATDLRETAKSILAVKEISPIQRSSGNKFSHTFRLGLSLNNPFIPQTGISGSRKSYLDVTEGFDNDVTDLSASEAQEAPEFTFKLSIVSLADASKKKVIEGRFAKGHSIRISQNTEMGNIKSGIPSSSVLNNTINDLERRVREKICGDTDSSCRQDKDKLSKDLSDSRKLLDLSNRYSGTASEIKVLFKSVPVQTASGAPKSLIHPGFVEVSVEIDNPQNFLFGHEKNLVSMGRVSSLFDPDQSFKINLELGAFDRGYKNKDGVNARSYASEVATAVAGYDRMANLSYKMNVNVPSGLGSAASMSLLQTYQDNAYRWADASYNHALISNRASPVATWPSEKVDPYEMDEKCAFAGEPTDWSESFANVAPLSWHFANNAGTLLHELEPSQNLSPLNDRDIPQDVSRASPTERFHVASTRGECIITREVKKFFGFWTCKDLIIEDRSDPLLIRGTVLVLRRAKIHPNALRAGIRWSNMQTPDAIRNLRSADVLRPPSGSCADFPRPGATTAAVPDWYRKKSMNHFQRSYMCGTELLRSLAKPYTWTAVDPDCGLTLGETYTKCKNQVKNYISSEIYRDFGKAN